MGGHQDGLALVLELGHDLEELGGGLGVEPRGRLVEQDGRGVLDDGDGDAQLLPHAFGEVLDALVEGLLLERDPAHDLIIVVLGEVGLAAELGEEVEVLAGREVAVEHDVLGDESDVLLGLERVLVDVDALDEAGPGRRRDEVQEEVDRRRLAGAVGPEQAVDLARPDLQVEVVEGQHAVLVSLGQVVGFQDGIRVGHRFLLGRSSAHRI